MFWTVRRSVSLRLAHLSIWRSWSKERERRSRKRRREQGPGHSANGYWERGACPATTVRNARRRAQRFWEPVEEHRFIFERIRRTCRTQLAATKIEAIRGRYFGLRQAPLRLEELLDLFGNLVAWAMLVAMFQCVAVRVRGGRPPAAAAADRERRRVLESKGLGCISIEAGVILDRPNGLLRKKWAQLGVTLTAVGLSRRSLDQ